MDWRDNSDALSGGNGKPDQESMTPGAHHKSGARHEVGAAPWLTKDTCNAVSDFRPAREEEGRETIAHTQAMSASPSTSAHNMRLKARRTSSFPRSVETDESLSKSSLNFILDNSAASVAIGSGRSTRDCARAAVSVCRSRSTGDLPDEMSADIAIGIDSGSAPKSHEDRTSRASGKQVGAGGKRRARRPPSRICKHEDCEQYVVDQGLCVRHGGGKRCHSLGCTSRAKHQGRCWKHGGSIECKVLSCINRAKSRGFCWSHGGGTKCRTENCEKIAISNALCWAHGGGKRCVMEDCMRQAYERTNNLCTYHYHEQQRSAAGGRNDAGVRRPNCSPEN